MLKSQPVGTGMIPCKTKLGAFIRARRLELDLRQRFLDKLVGWGLVTSAFEVGKRQYLNEQQLNGLAKALQCDAKELIERMPVKKILQIQTELGQLIHSRRQELGLSLPAFAKKMKLTFSQARMWELRYHPTIHYGQIKRLSNALKLPPLTFVKFVGAHSKQPQNKLGLLIRARRQEFDMSIQMLAKKLNVSRQFVSLIELGRNPLTDERIKQLAQILKLNVNKLKIVQPPRKKRGRPKSQKNNAAQEIN